VRRALNILFALSLAIGATGCASANFGYPKIFGPTLPTRYQQVRAEKFDPYAEYGPALGESRPPRGFGDQPLAEPTRGRWQEWGAPRFGFE
jgi:hypothetical protein